MKAIRENNRQFIDGLFILIGIVIAVAICAISVIVIVRSVSALPGLLTELPKDQRTRDLTYWLMGFLTVGSICILARLFYSWKIIAVRGGYALAVIAAGSQSVFGSYNENAGQLEMFSAVLFAVLLTGVAGYYMGRAAEHWREGAYKNAVAWAVVAVVCLSISFRTDSLQYGIVASMGGNAIEKREQDQEDIRTGKAVVVDSLSDLRSQREAAINAREAADEAFLIADQAKRELDQRIAAEAANGGCGRVCQDMKAAGAGVVETYTIALEERRLAREEVTRLNDLIGKAETRVTDRTIDRQAVTQNTTHEEGSREYARATTAQAWETLWGNELGWLGIATRQIDAYVRAFWLNFLAMMLPATLPKVRGLPSGGLLTPMMRGRASWQEILRLKRSLAAQGEKIQKLKERKRQERLAALNALAAEHDLVVRGLNLELETRKRPSVEISPTENPDTITELTGPLIQEVYENLMRRDPMRHQRAMVSRAISNNRSHKAILSDLSDSPQNIDYQSAAALEAVKAYISVYNSLSPSPIVGAQA